MPCELANLATILKGMAVLPGFYLIWEWKTTLYSGTSKALPMSSSTDSVYWKRISSKVIVRDCSIPSRCEPQSGPGRSSEMH